ncbi:cytochrome c oxidase subunit 3 [Lacipirellula limnantheis]|uniref:Cytochrome bo(3) ubiquinol oxidase subunit 3 n=1 Tax=Lacipirellula limnantheis TaxID=2528024 RepID=A0A517U4M8_9BACT|nr:cytochrome c oxidase subunit 3 [Lacipirellula limnantheis]QDT75593.1 Cytochrome c oxidase subunit 3 [Lacipirellula limnantheis]
MTYPAAELPIPPEIAPERTLSAAQWGMASFLVSEVAFFSTLIVAYVTFLGRDTVGPTPAQALSLKLAFGTTLCLVASSVIIHFAEAALRRGNHAAFKVLWAMTIALGAAFLLGTAFEWHDLITRQELTISRNLFGTTFYTLVGFHGLHVTAGVIAMSIVLLLAARGAVAKEHDTAVQLVSWYWHFVDVVWIVVFLVVYVGAKGGTA